jgi:2,5-diamino-6-(ribosylamino)-4(3H)-pyrimidinone 5'-phosphate reductase
VSPASKPVETNIQVQLVPQDDASLLPPQPLVLDPQLRIPVSARMLSEWRTHGPNNATAAGPRIVRQPWVLCGEGADEERAKALEEAGARVVRVPLVDGTLGQD